MDSQEHEQALRQLGLRNADGLAERWAGYGIRPQEMLAWISAGIAVDEPHIAAALAAAEWTPDQAGRNVSSGDHITLVQAVREHPNAANYARELRAAAG
ncbi:MAG: hypothetical protein LCH87_11060 [Actinobacteria bacterium]|nr:hypothetical protein [Actinomycetota bacterium]